MMPDEFYVLPFLFLGVIALALLLLYFNGGGR